jgi:hypothetical protein
MNSEIKSEQYKGYFIQTETNPWALKYGMRVRFFIDENIQHASSFEEAREEIDERINQTIEC